MSKYCDEVESAVYMDEQGVVHDLTIEDIAEMGYLLKAQLEVNRKSLREEVN